MKSNLITAVGIDISKGKSIVAIRRPGGEIVRKPFEVRYDQPRLQQFVQTLQKVGGKCGSLWSIRACTGGLLLLCCSAAVFSSA